MAAPLQDILPYSSVWKATEEAKGNGHAQGFVKTVPGTLLTYFPFEPEKTRVAQQQLLQLDFLIHTDFSSYLSTCRAVTVIDFSSRHLICDQG